jgi:hypothetical protein
LPRLIDSASNLRFAPRSFAWSKTTVPCTRDRTLLSRFRSSPAHTAYPRADFRIKAPWQTTIIRIAALAEDLEPRRRFPHQPSQGDWTVRLKRLWDRGASPTLRIPRRDCARTAEECGRSTAQGRDRTASRVVRGDFAPGASSKNSRLYRRSTGGILTIRPLTMPIAEDYITVLARRRLARWRVCEAPHCLRGEPSGHELWSCRMFGLRRLRSLPETGL